MEIKARANKCARSEFGYNSQKHVEHKIRILATLARERVKMGYFIYKGNDIL